MLAVARKDEVARGERVSGADLHGLLTAARRPQRELSLPLERDALGVEAAGEDHVAMEGAQLVGGQIDDPRVEPGVGHPGSVGLQQTRDVVDVPRSGGAAVVGRPVGRGGGRVPFVHGGCGDG